MVFGKRLAEEAAVAAVIAFGGLVVADGTGFTVAALVAGGQAAARALYGVIVRNFGPDAEKPSAL